MAFKTKDERRREVELLVLAGRSVGEIAKMVGAHEDTVARDIDWLQERWSEKPEAKDAYDRRVATLRAMSQYALEQSQVEKNPPNTRLSWFQGWQKIADQLAILTGVEKYAEEALKTGLSIRSALEIVGEIWEGQFECPECGFGWEKERRGAEEVPAPSLTKRELIEA